MLFLLMTRGRVPSYLGTSASFVGVVAAVRADGGTSAEVTGAIPVTGVVLALVGLAVHLGGARVVSAVLPPAVTGAVVLLIGLNLAPVVAGTYWPQDQGVALVTMLVVMVVAVAGRGMLGRLAVLVGLVVGYRLSAAARRRARADHGARRLGGRVDAPAGRPLGGRAARLGRAAPRHPRRSRAAPARVQRRGDRPRGAGGHRADRREHRSRQGGRGDDPRGPRPLPRARAGRRRPRHGRRRRGRRLPDHDLRREHRGHGRDAGVLDRGLLGRRPRRGAIGFCPKFGAVVAATPGGVLGGITVVLYGMIGLLGARIWVDNRVDFARPEVLVPLAAGIVIGVGEVALTSPAASSAGSRWARSSSSAATTCCAAWRRAAVPARPGRADPTPAVTGEDAEVPPAER